MIYVLTDGTYSDYHIVCVTEDYKIADAYSKLHGYKIEEFEPVTDKSIIKAYKNSIAMWKYTFEPKGYLTKCARMTNAEEYSKPEVHLNQNGESFVYVCENDEEKARKIAIDARAKYISEMFGL